MGTRAMNRFDLYELCVQAPDSCARFVDALLDGEPATIEIGRASCRERV